MMKMYGIFDRASEMYVDRVMVLPADGVAIRIFREACADQRSEISKHPTDYELHCLGEFDTRSGIITPTTQLLERGEKAPNE